MNTSVILRIVQAIGVVLIIASLHFPPKQWEFYAFIIGIAMFATSIELSVRS